MRESMMHDNNFVAVSRREVNEMSPLHLPSAPSPQSEEWMSKHEEASSHENTHYQEDSNYYGWQSSSSLGEARSSQQTKSSPIAIIRSHNRGLPGHNDPPRGSDDDDDDDSSIDVELDALKLQEKYGETISDEKKVSASLLKAPYLGSMLSRSENYISVPPISLTMGSMVEPLMEINDGHGYGSLRDSHQKGTFLDGPASYRDGQSGQIKRLDHRVRFHASSAQPSISIGERIQQARKNKEIQMQKEQDKKEPTTSSLSAMMDQVIQKSDATTDHSKRPTQVHESFPAPYVASRGFGDLKNFGAGDEDERNMLSTSLTGIEVLMAANRLRPPPGSLAQSYAAPSYNSFLLQPPANMVTATGDDQTTGDYRPHFNPLSRTLSDPTPHMHNPNRSPGLGGALQLSQQQQQQQQQHLQVPARPGWTPYGPMVDPPSMSLTSDHPPSSLLSGGLASHHHHHPPTMAYHSSPVDIPYHLTSPSDHNPDTDAAFDMDME
jgi:hypothetical protein